MVLTRSQAHRIHSAPQKASGRCQQQKSILDFYGTGNNLPTRNETANTRRQGINQLLPDRHVSSFNSSDSSGFSMTHHTVGDGFDAATADEMIIWFMDPALYGDVFNGPVQDQHPQAKTMPAGGKEAPATANR
ncbi:Hypothetical predicted protein [Podarcis lilfordi]|uniref:Uncharacterized protein n=1 Tax=Podarcis lilfordi TaxID=74358 RepID=A0AA35K6I6_9SAUR|nr:Hypothetical predicted protein [Podarcis lilfordi]